MPADMASGLLGCGYHGVIGEPEGLVFRYGLFAFLHTYILPQIYGKILDTFAFELDIF